MAGTMVTARRAHDSLADEPGSDYGFHLVWFDIPDPDAPVLVVFDPARAEALEPVLQLERRGAVMP